MIALLNDIRFQAGKSSLGFLNPLIYQHPEIFNDVTVGSNPGCSTNGFYAEPGWDPVTGMGTIAFDKWTKLIQQLP